VGKHPDDGRAQRYQYGNLSISDISENLEDIVCSEFCNGKYPIDSASIQQSGETDRIELVRLLLDGVDGKTGIERYGFTISSDINTS
jgi:hypothetical protein